MKIEDQVCTLEQAKELRELGLELDSYFVWITLREKNYSFLDQRGVYSSVTSAISWLEIPAYTCAELGVLLPHKIKGRFEPIFRPEEAYDGEFEYIQEGKEYYGCFRWGYHRFTDRYQDDSHWLAGSILACETHAKSEILIECLREGYIKPEDLKL